MDKIVTHKLFYYIVAHKNPEQLALLVNQLKADNTIICIHIDKKTDIKPFKNKVYETAQIYFIKKRINVFWAGFSQVECTLLGLHEALKYQIGHFILLSGQDFPIKSNNYLNNFFQNSNDLNYMSYAHIDTQWKEVKHRITKYYYVDFISKIKYKWTGAIYFVNKIEGFINKLQVLFSRKMLQNIEYYAGGNWVIFNRETVKYICDYIESNPRLISFFKNVNYSDELFFQTLLLNSPLKNSVVNDNKRFVIFENSKSNPEILTTKNLDNLINSSALFARKFDANVDESIIKQLKNYLAK